MSNNSLNQFDAWLTDDSPFAALTLRQWLEPAEGKDAVFFPPTFAKPEGRRSEDWTGYNIDQFPDGTNVCLIDSVGAQANRMEPVFMRDGYSALVPQVTFTVENRTVNLLEAGHRIADAVVRFSNLSDEIKNALLAIRNEGNAQALVKLAPTSVVFGAWDSRDTQVKLPRIVRSTIRAFNVQVLHRSAQYRPAIDYVEAGVFTEEEKTTNRDALSTAGFNDAPAAWTHGGVRLAANGEIRRDAMVNLAALRRFQVPGNDNDTLALRRYLLGLSLVAITVEQREPLREGGELVLSSAPKPEWKKVKYDGTRENETVTHEAAMQFAQTAATAFVINKERTAAFDSKSAKGALKAKDKPAKGKGGKNKASDAESKGDDKPTTGE